MLPKREDEMNDRKLSDLAGRQSLSRRQLLSRSAALAGGAVLGVLALPGNACAEETPRSGGPLRLGPAGGSTPDRPGPRTLYASAPICIGYPDIDRILWIIEPQLS